MTASKLVQIRRKGLILSGSSSSIRLQNDINFLDFGFWDLAILEEGNFDNGDDVKQTQE